MIALGDGFWDTFPRQATLRVQSSDKCSNSNHGRNERPTLPRSWRPSYADNLWLKPCPRIVHLSSVNIKSSAGLNRFDLSACFAKRYITAMDELTTSIVGIDFPNEDKIKSSRRMEGMLCAPGDVVELRLKPTNPFDNNAVAIFSERGTQLGYVSAERAPLIGDRMKEGEAIAVFQAMHGSEAYIRIRFGGRVPTLPDPVPDVPKRPPPRQARPTQRPVYDPHAF